MRLLADNQQHRPRSCKQSQFGAVIVEAAFILPFLLLVVGGLIDIGLAIRRTHILASAVHQAARTTASVSLRDDQLQKVAADGLWRRTNMQIMAGSPCRGFNPSGGSTRCESVPLYRDPPFILSCSGEDANNLECQAMQNAEAYLRQAGLNPDDWHISALTCEGFEPAPSDGVGAAIRVSIIRRAGRGCSLCFFSDWIGSSGDDPAQGWFDRATSTFLLEGECL